MAVISADDCKINSEEAAAYFARPSTDRRVLLGFRLALELLGIPLPDYAKRKEAGRHNAARVALATAYDADHGRKGKRKLPPPLTQEQINHRVACAVAKTRQRHSTT